jgi:hypothetical protein
MIGIEREAKANLIACFSAESNAQEDEWWAAYFDLLMEHLKALLVSHILYTVFHIDI